MREEYTVSTQSAIEIKDNMKSNLPQKPDQTPQFSMQEVENASIEYFGGDSLAGTVFSTKYALRNNNIISLKDGDEPKQFVELTPDAMHDRLAYAFALKDSQYSNPVSFDTFRSALNRFKYIVPQGSPMYGVGNPFVKVSISNCVVVDYPKDNMSGIMESGKDLANLFKRRCGVGLSLDTLRPDGTAVSNSAGTSTGAWSFANYFSEVCRMIGQNGRRGALMITMNVLHPDIPQFTTMKRDTSRVTGANVSIMLTDEFMLAVENNQDWICRWPLNADVDAILEQGGEWQSYDAAPHLNRPIACKKWIPNTPSKDSVLVSYNATQLWHLINESAVTCAEPGLLFWDNYGNNLPAHSYDEFKLVCVNPCVTDDTWIMTDKGAVQVKNLIGTPFNAIVDGKSYSSTERGFYETGTKHVFEVKTSRGYSLKATANHPVLVETKNKRAKAVRTWKNVGDLEIGDKIVLNRHKNVQWDGAGTKDEGWLLGNLLGDGNMQKNGISNLDFWGENREDMLSVAIATILESVGGRSDMTGQNQEEYNRSRVSSSKLNLLANKFGMTHGNKKLNELIENSSSDFHSGFLKGWFDADGSVQGNLEKGLSVRLTSVSLDGLLGAQRMLARLGILSNVYMNRHSESYQMMPDGHGGNKEYYCQARHELTIANENIQTFVERVGFVDSDKMDKLSSIIKQYKRSVNKDSGYSVVCEVNPIGVETVYDCTVPEISAFDANGLMVHNCAEIGLSPYDSCRLTSLNLKGYVLNPYTKDAKFDYETFGEMTRLGMRIMDDIVDIEIDCLTKIIDSCDEPEEQVLWNKLRNAAERGRRTGLGMHGLADALACLNLRYDSDEALAEVDKISEVFCVSAYDASVDLAIERGSFPAFDWNTEKDCAFIKRLPDWLQEKMSKYGRRNISLLTIAPTGSVSIVSQTSSGLEPVFSNFYTRRRKINPSDVGARVDFTDQNGDKWQEYPVFHNNVQQYLIATNKMEEWKKIEESTPVKNWAEEFQKILPEWFVTAPEIDAKRRVEIQGHIQRWIDHGISSTINMPRGTTIEQGQELYMLAWKHGLKGVTIYVDGSRSGVLVNFGESKDPATEIVEAKCPKRPKELPCDIHHVKVDGIDWVAFVSLLNGVPYEVFGGAKEQVDIPKKIKKGKIAKRKCDKVNAKGRTACYDLIVGEDDDEWKIKDVAVSFENGNYAAQTRMISLSLRHGVPAQFIAEQLSRDLESDFHSFSRVMARVLKQYVVDGATGSEKCPNCGDKLRFENGCTLCPNCGEGKCS